MPAWLQGFAAHQPVTPVIETLRGLLLGTPVGSQAWIALAWCAGILAVSVALAGVAVPAPDRRLRRALSRLPAGWESALSLAGQPLGA